MNNLVASFGLALLLVSVVKTYDFDNSEYNRILSEDLEDWNDPLQDDDIPTAVHIRSRRDEEAAAGNLGKDKCKRQRFRGCCADDTMEALHDDDKQIKRECYKEVTGRDRESRGYSTYFGDHFKCDKDKMEKHKKEMTCVFQCVGKKRNVVDSEGKLLEAEFKKILKEKFVKYEAEAWLMPKLDEISKKCYEEASKVVETPEKVEKVEKVEKDSCNASTIKASFCLWREIQMACPANKIKDEKYCSKLRERIKTQPDNIFRPSIMMMSDFE